MSEHPNTGGETTATSKQFNLDRNRAAPSARPTLAPISPATPMRARGHVIFTCQGRRCVQRSHPETERWAVQPACRSRLVRIAAQTVHGCQRSLHQRRADRRIECIVAEPNGSEDGQEVERPRVERFGSVLCDHKHEPLDARPSSEEHQTGRTHMLRSNSVALMVVAAGPAAGSFAQDVASEAAIQAIVSDTVHSSRRMPDSKQWTTDNLNVNTGQSYCYQDTELNCRRYGRLYTWEAAQRGCQSLGAGWRLPTEDEWRRLAKHYGGVHDDSDDGGKAAYKALVIGGSSGFNALLGGGHVSDEYARLEAHGFYWTASETDPVSAWFYNFAKGGLSLYRQREGNKEMAVSVRCVRE